MYLLALPQELLLQIIEHLGETEDKESLTAVASTCKQLHHIAEARLYSSALFISRESLCHFLDAMDAKPKRRQYLQDLQLMFSTRRYEYHDKKVEPVDLGLFENLRAFESESPECQTWSIKGTIQWRVDMDSYMDTFEQASLLSQLPDPEKPLQKLKYLKLQWTGTHGKRYWDISPACPIFLLPQLQSLEISCARIGQPISGPVGSWDEEWLREYSRKIRLTSLALIECTISTEALGALLSLPVALERLVLCETAHHEVALRDCFATSNSELFNRAIRQQRDTLKYLQIMTCPTYLSMSEKIERPLALSLGEFRALTHLRLGPFRTAPRTTGQRPDLCTLSSPAPPALKHLRLDEIPFSLFARRPATDAVLSELLVDELIANAAARPGDGPLQVEMSLMRIMPNLPPRILQHRPPIRRLVQDFAKNFHQRRPQYRLRPSQDREEHSPSPETEGSNNSASPPGISGGDDSSTAAMDRTSQPRLRILTLKHSSMIPPYLHTIKPPHFVTYYDSWHPQHPVP